MAETAQDVQYRIARPADADRIAVLSRDNVEAGLPAWQWNPRRVRAALTQRDTCTVIGVRQQTVVGFAMMFYGGREGHLNLLAVDPEWRRQGIGRALLTWHETSAQTAGITEIELEVRVDNVPAQRFYNALGYAPARTIPGYYCGLIAAVQMRRTIGVCAAWCGD